jgi:hypothetical protein
MPIEKSDGLTQSEEVSSQNHLIDESTSNWKRGLTREQIKTFVNFDQDGKVLIRFDKASIPYAKLSD